ncbi:hypothetical protein R1flu_018810 [Riccia fluitans]|uniref:Uncharacterized protein n=1 Tax=Riccia fluitans TaxID=41844 RepID=A0ABD1ZH40_9MARC
MADSSRSSEGRHGREETGFSRAVCIKSRRKWTGGETGTLDESDLLLIVVDPSLAAVARTLGKSTSPIDLAADQNLQIRWTHTDGDLDS